MIFLAALVLVAFSLATFLWARAAARRRSRETRLHSRPVYHGLYGLIWTAVPALLLLMAVASFDGRVTQSVLVSAASDTVMSMEAPRREAFFNDARRVAEGSRPNIEWSGALETEFDETAARASRVSGTLRWGAIFAAFALAVIGGMLAVRRFSPERRVRNRVEGWATGVLFLSSAVAVLTTVGIVASLVLESIRFFQAVPIGEFLFGTQWSPQIAIRMDQVGSTGAFGAAPLFVGTFLIMMIAMLVAGPIGLFSAIYLSEYAGGKTRAIIKPLLEVLAGVPTVVYGFFAALTVGPAFREFFNWIGAQLVGGPLDGIGQYLLLVQNQMALVAGAVMGIMLIPFVSSLSDDIINAVPQSLRDGSYALGATQSETVTRVLLPAALPGIAGAFLLAISRAIGETMIVTMAAGLAANMTLNPLDTVTTVTVQIVTLLTGDQEFNSPKTLAAFGLGLTLFVVTLILNIVAQRIVLAYREQYD